MVALLTDPSEIVMLTMVAVAAIIGVRILRDITSSTRKRRYARPAKYVLLLSLGLGVLFSFYETPALIVAEMTSITIFISSLYYYLVGGWLTSHQNFRSFWLPSESIKDWFFYLSLYTAVVGVTSGVLSVILPYFTSIVVPNTVSTVYSGISVLAALLEFTILLPEKTIICGLIYAFSFVTRRFSGGRDFYIEDIDFGRIVTHTIYSEFDVREALESLVKQGFAVKQSPTPMGRVRFKINVYGARYLEVCWTETLIRISRQKDRVEKILAYVEHRLKGLDPSDSTIITKALEEIKTQKETLTRLREDYGPAVGDSWYQKTVRRIEWLETKFREADSYQKTEAKSTSLRES